LFSRVNYKFAWKFSAGKLREDVLCVTGQLSMGCVLSTAGYAGWLPSSPDEPGLRAEEQNSELKIRCHLLVLLYLAES